MESSVLASYCGGRQGSNYQRICQACVLSAVSPLCLRVSLPAHCSKYHFDLVPPSRQPPSPAHRCDGYQDICFMIVNCIQEDSLEAVST